MSATDVTTTLKQEQGSNVSDELKEQKKGVNAQFQELDDLVLLDKLKNDCLPYSDPTKRTLKRAYLDNCYPMFEEWIIQNEIYTDAVCSDRMFAKNNVHEEMERLIERYQNKMTRKSKVNDFETIYQLLKISDQFVIIHKDGVEYVIDTFQTERPTEIKISDFAKNNPTKTIKYHFKPKKHDSDYEDDEDNKDDSYKIKEVMTCKEWIDRFPFKRVFDGGLEFLPYSLVDVKKNPDLVFRKVPVTLPNNNGTVTAYNYYMPEWVNFLNVAISGEEVQLSKQILADFLTICDFHSKVNNADESIRQSYKNEILGFLAHLVQRPSEKPTKILMFISEVGTGKGTLINVFNSVLGSQYVFDGSMDRISKFDGCTVNKLLVAYEEKNLTLSDYQILKESSGIDTNSFEDKGKNAYSCRNYRRFLVCTNHEEVLTVTDKNDRRAIELVTVGNDATSELIQACERLNLAVKKSTLIVAKTIYDFLDAYDLSNFNPFMMPKDIREFQRNNEIERDPLKSAIWEIANDPRYATLTITVSNTTLRKRCNTDLNKVLNYLAEQLGYFLKLTPKEYEIFLDYLTTTKDYCYSAEKKFKKVCLRDVFFNATYYENRTVKSLTLKTSKQLITGLKSI